MIEHPDLSIRRSIGWQREVEVVYVLSQANLSHGMVSKSTKLSIGFGISIADFRPLLDLLLALFSSKTTCWEGAVVLLAASFICSLVNVSSSSNVRFVYTVHRLVAFVASELPQRQPRQDILNKGRLHDGLAVDHTSRRRRRKSQRGHDKKRGARGHSKPRSRTQP